MITHLPFQMAGKIFRSPMPFSYAYDSEGEILSEYLHHHISSVVMLVGDEEAFTKSGQELRQLYQREGLKVIQFPIQDYGVPDITRLEQFVDRVLEKLHSGENVAIHCSAGQGRTGTFLAAMARRALGMDGDEAITWVREYIPFAIETWDQEEMVRRCFAG